MNRIDQPYATSDRSIETRYRIADGENGQRYVEIRSSHNKDGKRLQSRVTIIEVDTSPGYTITHWSSDTPYTGLDTLPIARYSLKALREYHEWNLIRFERGDWTDNYELRVMRAAIADYENGAAA